MTEHWISGHRDHLESAADKYGFSLSVSDSPEGPVEFEAEDGSEVSLTDSRSRTGTVAVEYTPSEGAKAGVNLNKSGGWMDDYHHKSFSDIENAVGWVEKVLKQHEKKN